MEDRKPDILTKEGIEAKAKWLAAHGFNAAGVTYLPIGDTYSIKDELKANGFKFDKTLMWHGPEPKGYECIWIPAEDFITFASWGEGYYHKDAAFAIRDLLSAYRPKSNSQWIGVEKEKFEDLEVTLQSDRIIQGYYGLTHLYKFSFDEDEITWFTSKDLGLEIGDTVLLSGTIKKLDEYKGTKTTVVTRCKVEEI